MPRRRVAEHGALRGRQRRKPAIHERLPATYTVHSPGFMLQCRRLVHALCPAHMPLCYPVTTGALVRQVVRVSYGAGY
jgi:hypothetical protein